MWIKYVIYWYKLMLQSYRWYGMGDVNRALLRAVGKSLEDWKQVHRPVARVVSKHKRAKRQLIVSHILGSALVIHIVWGLVGVVFTDHWQYMLIALDFAWLAWIAPDIPKLYAILDKGDRLDVTLTTSDMENVALCDNCYIAGHKDHFINRLCSTCRETKETNNNG